MGTQGNKAVFVREQNKGEQPQIAYRTLTGDKVSETNWVSESTNSTGNLMVDNQALVVYKVRNANKRNSIRWSRVTL